MRTELIDTARGRFGVRLTGDAGAPPVLLVHGFPDDGSTWDALGGALVACGYRAIAPYLRGYAPSPLDGDLSLSSLTDDMLAVLDAVAPGQVARYVGHDYGSQIGYDALTRAGDRFAAAVLLAGAHPANIARTIRAHPRQWWMSRYIVAMQLPGAARRLAAGDFAAVERLWRRWSPGFDARERLRVVKDTLRASMPGPVRMYRAGGFDIGDAPIGVRTLFIAGRDDGCLLPALAKGQERLFSGRYEERIWGGVGHWPHLERPDGAAAAVVEWFSRD